MKLCVVVTVHFWAGIQESLNILLFTLVSFVDAAGSQDGLSVGAKVAIAVGVLITLGILIGLCYCCCVKNKDRFHQAVETTGTSCLEASLCYQD